MLWWINNVSWADNDANMMRWCVSPCHRCWARDRWSLISVGAAVAHTWALWSLGSSWQGWLPGHSREEVRKTLSPGLLSFYWGGRTLRREANTERGNNIVNPHPVSLRLLSFVQIFHKQGRDNICMLWQAHAFKFLSNVKWSGDITKWQQWVWWEQVDTIQVWSEKSVCPVVCAQWYQGRLGHQRQLLSEGPAWQLLVLL